MDWLRSVADDFKGSSDQYFTARCGSCRRILDGSTDVGSLHIAIGNEPDRSGVHSALPQELHVLQRFQVLVGLVLLHDVRIG